MSTMNKVLTNILNNVTTNQNFIIQVKKQAQEYEANQYFNGASKTSIALALIYYNSKKVMNAEILKKLQKIPVDDQIEFNENYNIIEQVEFKKEYCQECNACEPEKQNPDIYEDHESGRVICKTTGIDLEGIIEIQARRAYTKKDADERNQHAVFHNKSTLNINRDDRNKLKISKSFERQAKIDHHTFAHVRSHNKGKHFLGVFTCNDLYRTPDYVKQLADKIFRKYSSKGFLKGRSIINAVGASLISAYKSSGVFLNRELFCENFNLDKNSIAKDCTLINNQIFPELKLKNLPTKFSSIITSLANNIMSDNQIVDVILKAKKLQKWDKLNGKDPKGVAAGIVYYYCTENKVKATQKLIARKAGISEVTLRERVKQLKHVLGKF